MGLESMHKLDLPERVDLLSDMFGIIPDDVPKHMYKEAYSKLFAIRLRARYGTAQNRRPYKLKAPQEVADHFISMINTEHCKDAAEQIKQLSTFKWLGY